MTAEQTVAIPEVERAACAILAAANIHHKPLKAWVAQLLADPNFKGHFDFDMMDAIKNFRDPEYAGIEKTWARNAYNRSDEAAMWLAGALRLFREDGRPTGDTTHGIGYGLTVTSPLAAAIGEYAERMQHALWNGITEVEDEYADREWERTHPQANQ